MLKRTEALSVNLAQLLIVSLTSTFRVKSNLKILIDLIMVNRYNLQDLVLVGFTFGRDR